MSTDDRFIRCTRCGDRIGVYERRVWQAPDGSVVPSGALAGSAEPPPGSLPYHESCSPTGPAPRLARAGETPAAQ